MIASPLLFSIRGASSLNSYAVQRPFLLTLTKRKFLPEGFRSQRTSTIYPLRPGHMSPQSEQPQNLMTKLVELACLGTSTVDM